jgi:hypothetical protein
MLPHGNSGFTGFTARDSLALRSCGPRTSWWGPGACNQPRRGCEWWGNPLPCTTVQVPSAEATFSIMRISAHFRVGGAGAGRLESGILPAGRQEPHGVVTSARAGGWARLAVGQLHPAKTQLPKPATLLAE